MKAPHINNSYPHNTMNEKSAADKKCIVSITHIGQCGPIYLHALNSFRVHLIEIKRMCSPNGLRVSECVCVCESVALAIRYRNGAFLCSRMPYPTQKSIGQSSRNEIDCFT